MTTNAHDELGAAGLRAGSLVHRRRRPSRRLLGWSDRRALERAGWRTLLEYREDHVRAADGTLLAVAPCWTAEAEHPAGGVLVSTVSAPSPDAAWARLRDAVRARTA